jgi:hypothetical protein
VVNSASRDIPTDIQHVSGGAQETNETKKGILSVGKRVSQGLPIDMNTMHKYTERAYAIEPRDMHIFIHIHIYTRRTYALEDQVGIVNCDIVRLLSFAIQLTEGVVFCKEVIYASNIAQLIEMK